MLFLHSVEVVFELNIWLLMGNSKEFHDFLEGLFEDGLVLLHEALFEADFIAAGDVLGGFLIEKSLFISASAYGRAVCTTGLLKSGLVLLGKSKSWHENRSKLLKS